ncbi:hypothetical protein QRD43_02935 [Pelomonas sp. APW6]|uniref:Transmembrane protein n=1 Tax=Roseateles subflavus TaxID=3053353 RepID=A0ABT7LF65_9BURK|nr:hypothetical protein [Pelomonas sp. APW6]MDL5030850.1 hypothetical protein [Pelomonas sp. APW6]
MIEGVASLMADILLPLLLGVFEMAVLVLVASVRPWRYVLSSSFRQRTHAEFAQRAAWVKWWHLFWGTAALVCSMAIVAGAVLLYGGPPAGAHPPRDPESMRAKALQTLGGAAARRASEARP